MASKDNLLPALLKYWRGTTGMSQLDLALAADVSARHVSFLETGRSQPSQEMLLRLAAAMQVPLRDQNALLQAAGFDERYPEPDLSSELDAPIQQAIERMLAQHEPYPMVIMDRYYNMLRTNRCAQKLLVRFVADPAGLAPPLNLMRALFDPRLARSFIQDWAPTARALLCRLQIESLQRPHDEALSRLVDALLELPDVDPSWKTPDFSRPSDPIFTLRLERDGLAVAFLTTVTVFSAPQNVTLDELRIESYFPLDDATAAACEILCEV